MSCWTHSHHRLLLEHLEQDWEGRLGLLWNYDISQSMHSNCILWFALTLKPWNQGLPIERVPIGWQNLLERLQAHVLPSFESKSEWDLQVGDKNNIKFWYYWYPSVEQLAWLMSGSHASARMTHRMKTQDSNAAFHKAVPGFIAKKNTRPRWASQANIQQKNRRANMV
jgi:hypothetical protein